MGINWRWLLAGIALYLVLLIAYMPASQVANRIDLPRNVKLGQVEGTLWHGEVDRVVVNNIPVNQLSWDVSPLALLTGHLALELDAGNMRDAAAIAFTGPLSLSLFDLQSVTAEDFLLYLPVDRVLAEVQLPLPVNAGGRFRVNIESLSYSGQGCDEMMAYGDWLNARVAGTRGPIELGTFSAQIRCQNEQIVIDVAEPNAFGLSMQATANQDFSGFKVKGQFKPDPSLPQEVHDAAMFFGRPDASGYTQFQL
ncbi:general secretion pathway protein GspN [Alteromonas lipolytica]|uniref:Type II secretion system protein N n=2 Tax=Alteromonas lipolytica TaxID=1856405 RepID=A0A1E8FCD1_9ALTE|nr:general secretion pathway protein GspN [Alteromonas lipolytica]